jgi:hypothetical protein
VRSAQRLMVPPMPARRHLELHLRGQTGGRSAHAMHPKVGRSRGNCYGSRRAGRPFVGPARDHRPTWTPTSMAALASSPTAAATRLVEPLRMSPAANTPGMDVSSHADDRSEGRRPSPGSSWGPVERKRSCRSGKRAWASSLAEGRRRDCRGSWDVDVPWTYSSAQTTSEAPMPSSSAT